MTNILQQPLSDRYHLLELILVADGSSDGTDEIITNLSKNVPLIKTWVFKSRLGKVQCVNKLLKHAAALHIDVAVFPMADTLPEIGTLNLLLQQFENEDVGGTCGRTIPVNGGQSIVGRVVRSIWKVHNLILQDHPKINGEMYAVRPQLIGQVPSYVPWEDAYIEIPILRKGQKITFVEDAVVYMNGPSTFRELIKQRIRINTGYLIVTRREGHKAPTTRVLILVRSCIGLAVGSGASLIPCLIIAAAIEGYARLIAFANYNRQGIPYVWERLTTTKGPLAT